MSTFQLSNFFLSLGLDHAFTIPFYLYRSFHISKDLSLGSSFPKPSFNKGSSEEFLPLAKFPGLIV